MKESTKKGPPDLFVVCLATKNPVDYCISYTSLQDFYISYISYISFFYILKTLPPASYVSSYAAFLLR